MVIHIPRPTEITANRGFTAAKRSSLVELALP
jgi:hypothetical protein